MSGHFAGGSLKLKGPDSVIKKKKKKSKSDKTALVSAIAKSAPPHPPEQPAHDAAALDSREEIVSGGAEDPTSSSHPPPRARRAKTAAEIKFEEIQRQRQQDRIAKTASSSHKERVAEFNKYLEGLSEHYDIPKVGPG